MRHIVAILDPRTGSHRIAGNVQLPGDTVPRITVEAKHVPTLAQHLNPQEGEAVVVLDVPDAAPAEPAKPQGIRLVRKDEA